MEEKDTGKRKGFFRSLFEKNRSAANEEPETIKTTVQQQEDKTAIDEIAEAAHLEVKGTLLEAWNKWSTDGRVLELSLLGNGNGCAVPLTEREIGLERVRLSAKIERDAKDYVRAMDKREETRVRIEAQKALVAAGEGGEEAAKGAAQTIPEVKSKCCVYTSANCMVAWIMLFPPSDPAETLDMTSLATALQENKVTTGIDSTVISYLYQQRPYFELIPCACGTPVQEGEDGRVIEHYPRQLNKSVKLDERGVADYRALNYMQVINEGDAICDIIPPKAGVAGMRVDGAVAEPRVGKAPAVPAGANTKISEDGTKLLAAKTGHLEFDGSKFLVKLILDIPTDVDYNTGNIEYNGDIHIRGDVRATFVVKATGNITIDGLVEAATVEAGGDVLISCGVLGDNSALIKSGGNVRAKYIDNCVVYAGKSVFADCIMSSQVYSDESVQVTSGRGAIIGGTIVAAHSIKSKLVGTESGRKTEIELGTLTYVKAEKGIDTAELKAYMDELTSLERDIGFLKKRQKMEGNEEKENPRLEAALIRKTAVCAKIEEMTKRQEELEELKPDPTKCRFESSTVYPPTLLTISGAIWKFEETKNSCVAILNKETGEIKVS